ncbi:hypothetical protein Bca4012_100041 [Brassica carinata]
MRDSSLTDSNEIADDLKIFAKPDGFQLRGQRLEDFARRFKSRIQSKLRSNHLRNLQESASVVTVIGKTLDKSRECSSEIDLQLTLSTELSAQDMDVFINKS